MPPKKFKEEVNKISDLIKKLNIILEKEGDIPVCTHNDPYWENQWIFPLDTMYVEENPNPVVGVVEYQNPKNIYKGKVLLID